MKNPILFFLVVCFCFHTAIYAQHRDESQMLWKSGMPPAHRKMHKTDSVTNKNSVPIDSIALSEAAAPLTYHEDESGDKFLQEGIQSLSRNDFIGALKLFNKASKEGNHEAQFRIALMYRDGIGINKDMKEAAYWFRKAASNGHTQAQFELGKCFLSGEGVLQDTRMAAESFWRAAEGGHPMASFYVARMYRDGVGMERNLKRAAKYMKQAADANVENARSEFEEINKMLSSSQKEKGINSANKKRGK